MKKRGIKTAIIIIAILATGAALYLRMAWYESVRSSESGENATIYYAEDGPEEPSITVWTEIPDGEVEDGEFDISYTVMPGRGAAIRRIYYLINGDIERRLYTYGDPNIKLSEGSVMMASGMKNKIVFYVEDTEGRTAEFAAENQPYYEFPDSPSFDESQLRPSRRGGDIRYVADWLILVTEDDIPDEEVMEMIKDIGGVIIDEMPSMDSYYIQVPESTEEELEAMCKQLNDKYKDQIAYTDLYYIGGVTLHQTDDPWWSEVPVGNTEDGLNEYKENTSMGRYVSNPIYHEWELPYRQWGLDAINAPAAWELMPDKINNIKIGVVDDGFGISHEDQKKGCKAKI